MLLFLLLLLAPSANATDTDYGPAIKAATDAAYKQSGLQGKFLTVKQASETKANTWLKLNGLAPIASVVGIAAPIIYYKKAVFHTGDFSFEFTKDTASSLFSLQF